MSSKKEEILITFLKLSAENGKASLGDIADTVGIKKASIYSHFRDFSDLESHALDYGYEALNQKKFQVNLKAQDPITLLEDLIQSFAKVFSPEPVSWYYSALVQGRLSDELYESHYRKVDLIIMSRIQVALELCVQENWLRISNTDYASMFLASTIKEKLPSLNNDWEFYEIPNRFINLFSFN